MARVVAPTGQLAAVRAVRPIQASRPAMLRSDFVGTSVSSMCSSIAGAAVAMVQAVAAPLVRGFFVEANAKKSIGCTKEGTSRKRARVSGFLTRMKMSQGRKVLARRRARGRKNLAPASMVAGKDR